MTRRHSCPPEITVMEMNSYPAGWGGPVKAWGIGGGAGPSAAASGGGGLSLTEDQWAQLKRREREEAERRREHQIDAITERIDLMSKKVATICSHLRIPVVTGGQ